MTVTSILAGVQGIGNLTQASVDILSRLATGSFASKLQPASFRGVPFGVISASSKFGRRNAIHEYPFRDTPWVEDLGRQARRFSVTGFIVGDDVIERRDAMIAACESSAAGSSTLVHPTFGKRSVALIDFEVTEDRDTGRVFEFRLSFIEQGLRIYPQSTQDNSKTAADAGAANAIAAAFEFVKRSAASLIQGAQVINGAVQQASAYAKASVDVINDATSLLRLAVTLPGEFGRLLGQARGIVRQATGLPIASGGLVGLVAASAAARSKVAIGAAGLNTAARGLGVSTAAAFAASVQALTQTVYDSAPTPADAIRAMVQLSASSTPAASSFGAALTVQQTAGDLMRRACVAGMVRAATVYQAASADEAKGVLTQVLGMIDAEITVAGNQREDDVYAALRNLWTAAVLALNQAGASLPVLTVFSTPTPLPALALAQRLYKDPSREAELVASANPPHPAFMPTKFTALNS